MRTDHLAVLILLLAAAVFSFGGMVGSCTAPRPDTPAEAWVAYMETKDDWQANHKTNWTHPAAWIHSGFHLGALLFVFRWEIALAVAATHFLIDLRTPLIWWRKLIGMKQFDPRPEMEGSMHNQIAVHVAFWQDQMAHIAILIIACLVA